MRLADLEFEPGAAYDAVDGGTLAVRADRALCARFLDYHDREIADF